MYIQYMYTPMYTFITIDDDRSLALNHTLRYNIIEGIMNHRIPRAATPRIAENLHGFCILLHYYYNSALFLVHMHCISCWENVNLVRQ